jgi:hypothetical protein
MRLQSTIMIFREPDKVWAFLSEASNIPKWDRGVAAVVSGPAGVTGVGSEFDTLASNDPSASGARNGRMSYRIAAIDTKSNQCTVELTSRDGNARFFKRAAWTFRADPADGGTLVTCSVEFVLRLRWLVMAPVLYFMRGAITRDLRQLKTALETD